MSAFFGFVADHLPESWSSVTSAPLGGAFGILGASDTPDPSDGGRWIARGNAASPVRFPSVRTGKAPCTKRFAPRADAADAGTLHAPSLVRAPEDQPARGASARWGGARIWA